MPTTAEPLVWTPKTILHGVKEVLKDALGIDDEDFVNPKRQNLDIMFMNDLGGESIDILDIAFRLERHFRTLKLYASDFHPHELGNFSDMQLSRELLPEILEAAQQKFPGITNWDYVRPIEESCIGDLITVRLFCLVIANKLEVKWEDPI